MFEKYHLSNNAQILTSSVPGQESLKLLIDQEKYESNNRSYPRDIPLAFDLAKGSILQDIDGNRYIDFTSICGVFNLGHNNEYILERMKSMEGKISQSVDYPTTVKINFLKSLLEALPETLKGKCKVNFGGPSGSDAVEAAIKLARINKKRHSVIAFHGGYHGMTMGALSVTSKLSHRKDASPLIPGVHFLPYCSSYRCPFAHGENGCQQECIKYFKYVLENPHSGIDKPAAIIIEPIQGEGGTYIPPEGWLEAITKIAHDNDILVIFDEIQSGFYRTGRLFSFEHTKAVPDIITMSKGIGGVGFPLSLIIYKKELDIWEPGTHIGTFRGSQLAMAAGTAALQFIKDFNIENYVSDLGKKMLDRLTIIKNVSSYIGEVRGIGMMFGIEYVKDKKSKEPFADMATEVKKKCYENGLIVEKGGYYNNVIRFLPPLITTQIIAQNGLDIFEKANKLAEVMNTKKDY
ncbi:MAG: aspartate aminotransferase family protein [Minisyncoccia bacterium]